MSDKHPVDTFTDAVAKDCMISMNRFMDLVLDENNSNRWVVALKIWEIVTKKIEEKISALQSKNSNEPDQ